MRARAAAPSPLTAQPDSAPSGAGSTLDGTPGVTLPGVIGPVTDDPGTSPTRTNSPAS